MAQAARVFSCVVFYLLAPAMAYADNCGGPSDCWATAGAAAAAAAAAGTIAAFAARGQIGGKAKHGRFLGVDDQNFLDPKYHQKMKANGWHLRGKEGHYEVWVDPEGNVLWIHTHPDQESSAIDADATTTDDTTTPDETDTVVQEARDKADWLEELKSGLSRDLDNLQNLVGTPQYEQKYRELTNEWNFFDNQLRSALKEIPDWQSEVSPDQMNSLETQTNRIQNLRDWVDGQASADFWQRLGQLPPP